MMTNVNITFDGAIHSHHHSQKTIAELAAYIKRESKTDKHPTVTFQPDADGWFGSIDLHGTYLTQDDLQQMINNCCPHQEGMRIAVKN
jgi:hypothetical protein